MKIIIESRDELRVIDLEDVVYLKASHNYTDLHYSDNRSKSMLVNLSTVEAMIAQSAEREGVANSFVRLGRSLLVNTAFVELVSVKHKMITFRTPGSMTLSATRMSLLALKQHLSQGDG